MMAAVMVFRSTDSVPRAIASAYRTTVPRDRYRPEGQKWYLAERERRMRMAGQDEAPLLADIKGKLLVRRRYQEGP
jgi:hypothetical protein